MKEELMFALVSNFEEESLEGEGDGTYGFLINLSRLAAIRQNQIHVQRNERKLRFLTCSF